MALIRLQNKTPSVYTEESRDFQLLCRLYDCIINGIKYDIDTMQNVTDTETCRSNILQLLQTKVGFFTNRYIDDDQLRYVLSAFPIMVKHKGSLQAIKEAINTYLKLHELTADVTVWYITDSSSIKTDTLGVETSGQHVFELTSIPVRLRSIKLTTSSESYIIDPSLYTIDNKTVTISDSVELNVDDELAITYSYNLSTAKGLEYNSDHTIVIGLGTELSDTKVLEEVFRYILPTGFGYYFYFFSSIDAVTRFTVDNNAILLYASDNINSQLRMQSDVINDTFLYRTLNGINTIELASEESYVDPDQYYGVVASLPTSANQYAIASIVENSILCSYIYYEEAWHKLTYKGFVNKAPSKRNATAWDVYYCDKDNMYEVYTGTTWYKSNALGVVAQDKLTDKKEGE